MTQTTDAMNTVNGVIEYSIDGAAAVDISGFANKLTATNPKRKTGEAYTADGDTPIVEGGKREPVDIDVQIVYTEGATDPFKALYDAYEAGSKVSWIWSPAGGAIDDFEFTAAEGPISECSLPPVDSEDPKPYIFSIKTRHPSVTDAVIAA